MSTPPGPRNPVFPFPRLPVSPSHLIRRNSTPHPVHTYGNHCHCYKFQHPPLLIPFAALVWMLFIGDDADPELSRAAARSFGMVGRSERRKQRRAFSRALIALDDAAGAGAVKEALYAFSEEVRTL